MKYIRSNAKRDDRIARPSRTQTYQRSEPRAMRILSILNIIRLTILIITIETGKSHNRKNFRLDNLTNSYYFIGCRRFIKPF